MLHLSNIHPQHTSANSKHQIPTESVYSSWAFDWEHYVSGANLWILFTIIIILWNVYYTFSIFYALVLAAALTTPLCSAAGVFLIEPLWPVNFSHFLSIVNPLFLLFQFVAAQSHRAIKSYWFLLMNEKCSRSIFCNSIHDVSVLLFTSVAPPWISPLHHSVSSTLFQHPIPCVTSRIFQHIRWYTVIW